MEDHGAFDIAPITDTVAGDDVDRQLVVAEAEAEPAYDPAKHKSGIVPVLQCVRACASRPSSAHTAG
jgi:hypothetical protein